MKPVSRFNLLARFMQRSPKSAVVAQIYTHVLNQPLLIEPTRAEALLNGYLRGQTDIVYGDLPLHTEVELVGPINGATGAAAARPGRIAVLNISGALVSRPMPGPSGSGPQSYEEIRQAFDDVMADDGFDAVVLRMDSPGGLVSGLFDLSDHVFAARGKKPIVAVVDDMAYSAAYAIAAAADKIYVSRTGGVGSVGAIAFHEDQSKFDEQVGVKVTAIYSGAHKNDFSPHEPLSDPARERLQERVDGLREMFVQAVAKYRGLKAEAVRDTEALTYYSQEAIDIGFADEVGTLEDALAALTSAPESEEQRAARLAAEEAERARLEEEKRRTAELRVKGLLASAVAKSDLPAEVATTLLGLNVSESEIEARVEHARAVVKTCEIAKAPKDLAAKFVRENKPVEEVGKELLDRKADIDRAVQVDARLPASVSTRPQTAPTLSSEIYKARREQAQKLTH